MTSIPSIMPLALTSSSTSLGLVRQGNSLTLNFGNWKALQYDVQGLVRIMLPLDLLESTNAKKIHKFEPANGDAVYDTGAYDQSIIDNPPRADFWNLYRKHLSIVMQERFSHWKSARAINHHNLTLDKLITQPEDREAILSQGIADLPDRNIWIYAPGKNAYLWNYCKEHEVMTVGWNYTGDIAQYETIKELQTNHPDTSRATCKNVI